MDPQVSHLRRVAVPVRLIRGLAAANRRAVRGIGMLPFSGRWLLRSLATAYTRERRPVWRRVRCATYGVTLAAYLTAHTIQGLVGVGASVRHLAEFTANPTPLMGAACGVDVMYTLANLVGTWAQVDLSRRLIRGLIRPHHADVLEGPDVLLHRAPVTFGAECARGMRRHPMQLGIDCAITFAGQMAFLATLGW